ncbi:MAG: YiiX/YebB-like N1pC/P60 family cysteine hydrolase [Flavobacteriales bacterium]
MQSCSWGGSQSSRPVLAEQDILHLIREGDVILKCGYGSISELITKFLGEEIKISHCAIVVKDDEGNFIMAQSISGQLEDTDGVQTATLKRFLQDVRPNSFFLLRHISHETDAASIASKTHQLVGQKIPFDHSFDNTDTTSLYCSEFVNLIFRQQYGKDCFDVVKKGDLTVYSFNSLLNNPDFNKIYAW